MWIGDDGHARLLDWSQSEGPPRFPAGSGPPSHAGDLPQAQRFLHPRGPVAASEDMISPAAGASANRGTRVPLPLPAADCLAKLGDQRFADVRSHGDGLEGRGLSGPAALSRTKRVVHLSLCAIPAILALVIGFASVVYVPWFVGAPAKCSTVGRHRAGRPV